MKLLSCERNYCANLSITLGSLLSMWSNAIGAFDRCAGALGAHEVIVQWTDDVINREIPRSDSERLDNARIQDCRDEPPLENKASRLSSFF